jgi:RHS repeat-associated protein
VPADYNENGSADIAVWRPSTGFWYIKDILTQQWGMSGDDPVPELYDAGAAADIAVWRPSNGVWYIKYTGGGEASIPWGQQGDIPVPEDWEETFADVTTYYIWSFDGKLLAEYDTSGAGVRDYIYFGDRLTAEYLPLQGKFYFYTPDQINSVRMVTDTTGTVAYSAAYDPYGGIEKTWAEFYKPQLKFSGKERDYESGLDYFGARYYANGQYRFISVDPIINREGAVSNPQLWNLYAYCGNNPITFLDPDGCEVIYASENLRAFFGSLAARSKMVRSTLALYEGQNAPNLIVQYGEVEPDIDGMRAYGNFRADIIADYAGMKEQAVPGMTLEQIEDLATWSIKKGILTIDNNLALSISDKATVLTALHELGHADQAARNPLEYRRQARIKRNPDGTPMRHERRPAEIYAHNYQNRASREIRQ